MAIDAWAAESLPEGTSVFQHNVGEFQPPNPIHFYLHEPLRLCFLCLSPFSPVVRRSNPLRRCRQQFLPELVAPQEPSFAQVLP
jgi:hypothetical protein